MHDDEDDLIATIEILIDADVQTEIDLESIDLGDSLDTLDTIEIPALGSVSGGMRWQGLPMSKNVEDRRTPAGKRRDQQWWDETHPSPTVPLPPRRPPGF